MQTDQNAENNCSHPRTRIIAIVTQCEDCGQPQTYRVASGVDRYADLCQRVYQGLIPPDMAMMADGLTDEQKAEISQLAPCAHDRRELIHCNCSGNENERCLDCGRRFADKSQWTLKHGDSASIGVPQ